MKSATTKSVTNSFDVSFGYPNEHTQTRLELKVDKWFEAEGGIQHE